MSPDEPRGHPAPSWHLPGSSQALLDAVTALSSDLDLNGVLGRIVESACTLTGARFGALGVLGPDGALSEFVTTCLDDEERTRASYGYPDGDPTTMSFLGVPVHLRGTVFGNLYLTEKEDGGDFTDTDEHLVVALARAAGLVIENARAYGLSERRRRWLEAAATLTDTLQPPMTGAQSLEQIAVTARRLSGARAVVVMSSDDDPVLRAVVGDADDVDDAIDATAEAIERTGVDTLADPVEISLDETPGTFATVLPLRTRLADGGIVVALFRREQQRLRDLDDRELLVSFADHAALALDRARAVADREEHAGTVDRERIARDLHDLVMQRLFATGAQLRAAALRGGEELPRRVEQSVADLDVTIRDVRATIFGLQRDGAESLPGDVRGLAADYAGRIGHSPVVRTVGPAETSVDATRRAEVLMVLREALDNVARHARSTRVEVELAVDGDELRLTVLDDGVGMGPVRQHTGLRHAGDRARSLGGALELSPRLPHGLLFRWRVPLDGPSRTPAHA